MGNLKYEQPKNYEIGKKNFLEVIKNFNGGVLPEGYDNELFISSFLRILHYLKDNYGAVKIKSKDIPDVGDFVGEQLDEYKIVPFLLCRLLKNVKSFHVEEINKRNSRVAGGYDRVKKNITLYTKTLNDNIDILKSKKNAYIGQFETNDDCEKILKEKVLVHELIHAISDNGRSVGFRDGPDTVAFNEGMTESLADDICGTREFLGEFFSSYPDILHRNNVQFALASQTDSGYRMESSVFNLIRVASKNDMTIPYLVDPKTIEFGFLGKFDIYQETNNVLDAIKEEFKRAHEEFNKKRAFFVGIDFDEEVYINNPNPYPLINLQSKLMCDIVRNKYGEEFRNRIKQNGLSQEGYDKLKSDLLVIGKSLIVEFPYKIDDEDRLEYARGFNGDYFSSSENLLKLMQNNFIEKNYNIVTYVNLLKFVEDLRELPKESISDKN